MSKFTLLHETPDHFVLHNGKSSFHVAKKGITEPTADKIRSFAQGGSIERNADIDTAPKDQDNSLPAIPQSDLDIYKPIELPQTEAPPKRREIEADMPEPEAMADGGQVKTPEKATPVSDDLNMYTHKMDVTNPEDVQKYQNIKQLSQETNLPKFDDGGGVQSFQDSFRKATHYNDGGTIQEQNPGVPQTVEQNFNKPVATEQESNREARYAAIRAKNSQQATSSDYDNGPIQSHAKGGSIANETQTQAIRRYADGNPATLAKGGHVHHNAGKNQLHFHFYDGAVVPTQLDKEEGAGPQQPSALDTYVGGEPAQGTLLDNYAEGGQTPSDSDKLEQAAQSIQAGLNSQTAPAPDATSTVASSSPSIPDNSGASTVPQAQQIPAVQKPLAPTPDQSPTLLSDFDKSLAQEKSGIEQGAAAQSQGYQDTAKAIGQNVLQQKQMQDTYKLEADKITQQNTDLFNAVASSKVDPNHYWNSKSTGGKIMATIGVLLGGIAGGANGTNQNQVMAQLQNHIQQDIEAQKNDQSNKMNLYKMGLERYRDAQSAQQFATLQSNALLQGQLQKIAAQTGSQTAMSTAQQMIGQLGVQNAGIRSDLAMKQAAFGAMNQPQPAQAGVDPNKMRLLINAGVIPKEEVPTAMKEYSDYTKLSDTLDHTDDVFKQAAANSTYSERALPGWTPTIRDKSKTYEAVTDAWLGNITKDTEGRVTPADIQLMKASLPKAGDNPQLIQTKLANIKDMIRQKYAFPTLQSYRLLGTNNAVSTPAATRQKKFTEGPPK